MAVRFSIDWDVPRKDPDREPDTAVATRAEQIRVLTRRRWVYRVLLIVAMLCNVWSLSLPHWQSNFEYLVESWSDLTLVWLAPFLLWGLFTQKRLARILATSVLAGIFLEQALQIGSQLYFLFFILSTSSLDWNLILVCFQITLQLIGLFAAVRLCFIDLRLQSLEQMQPHMPVEPVADLPSPLAPRILFDRLAPWLAVVPLLFDTGMNIQNGVVRLWGRNSWDAGIGLFFYLAVGVGVILAARGRTRWRVLVCGMASWFAVTQLLNTVHGLYGLDRDETYRFFGWADPHGRYLTAWWLFWGLMMAVALRAIFRLVPRDFASVTTNDAPESDITDVEDTTAQTTNWDEARPANPPPPGAE